MQALGQAYARVGSGLAAGTAVRHANVAGLTDREVEVLCLVAQGRTNRVIAVALVLSEKTVCAPPDDNFLQDRCRNRSGAVAFALRHGLA